MIGLVGLMVGLGFGGADQYLGSLPAEHWATSVSLLSAPWLVLPFLFGYAQATVRRSAWIGLFVTVAALVGYAVMTLSPIEGARPTLMGFVGFVRSDPRVIFGGLVSGPLYGWLGHRWRTRRAWASAALVAGAVCFEPLAERASGQLPSPSAVWQTEMGIGVLMGLIFVAMGVGYRRRSA